MKSTAQHIFCPDPLTSTPSRGLRRKRRTYLRLVASPKVYFSASQAYGMHLRQLPGGGLLGEDRKWAPKDPTTEEPTPPSRSLLPLPTGPHHARVNASTSRTSLAGHPHDFCMAARGLDCYDQPCNRTTPAVPPLPFCFGCGCQLQALGAAWAPRHPYPPCCTYVYSLGPFSCGLSFEVEIVCILTAQYLTRDKPYLHIFTNPGNVGSRHLFHTGIQPPCR